MKRLTLNLDENIFDKLKLLAFIRHTDVSKIIRQCILKRINQEEQVLDLTVMKITE